MTRPQFHDIRGHRIKPIPSMQANYLQVGRSRCRPKG